MTATEIVEIAYYESFFLIQILTNNSNMHINLKVISHMIQSHEWKHSAVL